MKNKENALIILAFIIFLAFIFSTLILPSLSHTMEITGKMTNGTGNVTAGPAILWLFPLILGIAATGYLAMKSIQNMHSK